MLKEKNNSLSTKNDNHTSFLFQVIYFRTKDLGTKRSSGRSIGRLSVKNTRRCALSFAMASLDQRSNSGKFPWWGATARHGQVKARDRASCMKQSQDFGWCSRNFSVATTTCFASRTPELDFRQKTSEPSTQPGFPAVRHRTLMTCFDMTKFVSVIPFPLNHQQETWERAFLHQTSKHFEKDDRAFVNDSPEHDLDAIQSRARRGGIFNCESNLSITEQMVPGHMRSRYERYVAASKENCQFQVSLSTCPKVVIRGTQ